MKSNFYVNDYLNKTSYVRRREENICESTCYKRIYEHWWNDILIYIKFYQIQQWKKSFYLLFSEQIVYPKNGRDSTDRLRTGSRSQVPDPCGVLPELLNAIWGLLT